MNGNAKLAAGWAAFSKVATILIPFIVALQMWLVGEAYAAKAFRNVGDRLTRQDADHILAKIEATDRAIRADMATAFAGLPPLKYETFVDLRFAEANHKIDKLTDAVMGMKLELAKLKATMERVADQN
jgi:hypothetical protein